MIYISTYVSSCLYWIGILLLILFGRTSTWVVFVSNSWYIPKSIDKVNGSLFYRFVSAIILEGLIILPVECVFILNQNFNAYGIDSTVWVSVEDSSS